MQIFIAVKLGINWRTFTATARATSTTRILKYNFSLTSHSTRHFYILLSAAVIRACDIIIPKSQHNVYEMESHCDVLNLL